MTKHPPTGQRNLPAAFLYLMLTIYSLIRFIQLDVSALTKIMSVVAAIGVLGGLYLLTRRFDDKGNE